MPLICKPDPIIKTKTLLNCERNSKPKFVFKNTNCASLLHAPTHTPSSSLYISMYTNRQLSVYRCTVFGLQVRMQISGKIALNPSIINTLDLHYQDLHLVSERDCTPLFSTNEAKSGLLCPDLGSQAWERHWCTGVSPVEGYQDGQGLPWHIRGEAESWVCLAIRRGGSGGS